MELERANYLVSAIMLGDSAAEREFYDEFKEQVEFFIRQRIGYANPDWKDLHQDIFVEVFNRILAGRFDSSRAGLGAFLQQTVKFKTLDYLKSRRHQDRINSNVSEQVVHEYPGSDDDLSDQIIHKEEKQLLINAILSLKKPYQTILILYCVRQMKIGEIADYLHIPEQKVSNYKSYAMSLVKKKLKSLKISTFISKNS